MGDNQTTGNVEMTQDPKQNPTPYDSQSRYYRNARIAEKRRKGATYKDLADEYAISISRVCQIVALQERRRVKMLEQMTAPLRHVT